MAMMRYSNSVQRGCTVTRTCVSVAVCSSSRAAQLGDFFVRERPVVGSEVGHGEGPIRGAGSVDLADGAGVPAVVGETASVRRPGAAIGRRPVDPEREGLALTAAGDMMPLAVEQALGRGEIDLPVKRTVTEDLFRLEPRQY